LQTIQQLQARALRRADTVDELNRLLYASKGKQRTEELRDDNTGLWAGLRRLFLPNRLVAKVEKLERDVSRARAALKIAVDELHQEHCQQLRAAPWSGSLLAPTETGLRDANDDYQPWNRVQMSGKRALHALHRIEYPNLDVVDKGLIFVDLALDGSGGPALSRMRRKIGAMNAAADPVRSFVNALRLLARERPEARAPADSRALSEIADRLAGVRSVFGVALAEGKVRAAASTIANLMASIASAAGPEFSEVEVAQDRLEEVNHQIALAAWSKIPARLRPPGR
jgi:hypothetical protein